MPYYYSLTLYNPCKPAEPPPVPPSFATDLKEAGRTINFSLLVGEILGIDTTRAIECLNEVHQATGLLDEADPTEAAPKLLLHDDIVVLSSVFSQILKALEEAIDDEGRPKGPRSEMLVRSTHIQQNDLGHLQLRSRNIDLLELRSELSELCLLLQFAASQNLWLQLE